MKTKGVPFVYLEFSRRLGGNHAPARAPPPLAAAGSGSGSLPGPVLFESGLTDLGYSDRTHSAIGPATADRKSPQAVTTVQTEPLQPFTVSFEHFYPFRSAINSAPYSQTKHNNKNT